MWRLEHLCPLNYLAYYCSSCCLTSATRLHSVSRVFSDAEDVAFRGCRRRTHATIDECAR